MGTFWKSALALAAPLLLAGCLLLPGKFDSKLRLMNDGTYSFSYVGQMQLVDGDEKPAAAADFDPDQQRCTNQIDKDTGEITPLAYAVEDYAEQAASDSEPYSYEDRACTAEEIAERQRLHDEDMAMMASSAESSKKDEEQKKAAMRAVFGGAVPGDDEGLKKFAEQLAKYDGWDKVEYVGNNLFEVEYRISGRFDQMLAFPTIPGATMQFPFVQVIRRSGGEIEVSTPAMAGPGGLAGAMGPMAMAGTSPQKMQPIDGNFSIETEGEVLSNNTADGYSSTGGLKILRWKVSEATSTTGGPRAIVKLAN